MFLLWTLLFMSTAAHKVTESTEDIPPDAFNTTNLYPVTNKTKPEEPREKTATSWKIETTFAESNLVKEDNNSTDSKEQLVVEKPENSSKEFKASPHLGNFFDADILEVVPTKESFGSFTPVIKKPPTAFTSSPKKKYPKDIFKNYNGFPYKMESPILTRAKDSWRPTSGGNGSGGGLEPTPTVEVPVRLPAGGLYQLPDPFKEKPSLSGDDDDFGLEFNGGAKETTVKKRVNPWKKLLHLITAFIPVGLIISALTPSVITIQNTGQDNQLPEYRAHPVRRSESAAGAGGTGGGGGVPAISERCRRRLLCELHAEKNYAAPPPPAGPAGLAGPAGRGAGASTKCRRLRCEEPDALARTLRLLLAHQYHHPAARDHRHHNT